jgi:multiple sugar transport system substrate-binding protein
MSKHYASARRAARSDRLFSPWRAGLALLLLFSILLSGCDLLQQIPLPENLPGQPTRTPPPLETPTEPLPTSTPGADLGFLSTATQPQALTLWLPPEFDPSAETPAGELIASRLEEFSRLHDGLIIHVRIKAPNGPGSLLESLNTASAAAPLSLPSLVVLSRADLESAALKGLLHPYDGVSSAIDQEDWYDYARQLARVQGTTFSLPFAGDALVLAYRPGLVNAPPAEWESVFRLGQPLAFSAGDVQALFVLTLYQSVGGLVEDAQRRPILQPEILSQVLQLLDDGEQRGIFPYWLSQYETNGQVWQAYRDQRVNALITWSSFYLTNLPEDTQALPVPALDDSPLTLATGWGIAIADPLPERRALAVALAEFLTESEFLSAWTEAAGYLPTRPSALASWDNEDMKNLLEPIAASAVARPTIDQLASLGPLLKDATLKVLKREADAAQAAQAAAERLSMPENR